MGADPRSKWLGLLTALALVGGGLAYLGWQQLEGETAETGRTKSPSNPWRDVKDQPSSSESTPRTATSPTCPPLVECPRIECEPTIVTVTRGGTAESVEREAVTKIQSALAEAMEAVAIPSSFDLDCTTYPCLAVFADQVPTIQERAAVISRLTESMPDSHLGSSSVISDDGKVSWVIVLAEDAPPEQTAVDNRVDELLLE